jgi:hypothetical protein
VKRASVIDRRKSKLAHLNGDAVNYTDYAKR